MKEPHILDGKDISMSGRQVHAIDGTYEEKRSIISLGPERILAV
jgi:hypothetical protein